MIHVTNNEWVSKIYRESLHINKKRTIFFKSHNVVLFRPENYL